MQFDYSITKTKRTTLSIMVKKDATVVVRVPFFMADTLVHDFVLRKINWITKTLKRMEHIDTVNVFKQDIHVGDIVVYLGKEYVVAIGDRKEAYLSENVLHIPHKYKDTIKLGLIAWYRNQTKKICIEFLDALSARTGLVYKTCRVTSARTRWASCSHDNTINCSFRMMALPLGVVEYIMVHELAHTQEKNHSKKFWNCVGEILPEYEERKEWLLRHRYTFPM